uniref:Uncharacterized protein n=1 Tax=Rhizophora mucronata TaxID=61149 RepID=A0A2P2QXI1_RHIMU
MAIHSIYLKTKMVNLRKIFDFYQPNPKQRKKILLPMPVYNL